MILNITYTREENEKIFVQASSLEPGEMFKFTSAITNNVFVGMICYDQSTATNKYLFIKGDEYTCSRFVLIDIPTEMKVERIEAELIIKD